MIQGHYSRKGKKFWKANEQLILEMTREQEFSLKGLKEDRKSIKQKFQSRSGTFLD